MTLLVHHDDVRAGMRLRDARKREQKSRHALAAALSQWRLARDWVRVLESWKPQNVTTQPETGQGDVLGDGSVSVGGSGDENAT